MPTLLGHLEAYLPESLRSDSLTRSHVPLRTGLDGASGEALLLIHQGRPALLVRDGPGKDFEQIILGDGQSLRVESNVLHISARDGNHTIGLDSWLDRELVESFLGELSPDWSKASTEPVVAPSHPLVGAAWIDPVTAPPEITRELRQARLEFLRDLAQPCELFAALLEARSQNPMTPAQRLPMPLDLDRIEKELAGATSTEIMQLLERMRRVWNLSVSSSPGGFVIANTRADQFFTVSAAIYQGREKIQLIKMVREFTSLGLKEAKDLVEQGGILVRNADAVQAQKAQEFFGPTGWVLTVAPVG